MEGRHTSAELCDPSLGGGHLLAQLLELLLGDRVLCLVHGGARDDLGSIVAAGGADPEENVIFLSELHGLLRGKVIEIGADVLRSRGVAAEMYASDLHYCGDQVAAVLGSN